LQFNDAPVIEGKAAVLGFLREFTRNFTSIEHSHGRSPGTSAALRAKRRSRSARPMTGDSPFAA
jgi:hypothetical protein